MILIGTRPANHHRLPAAGDCADQPRNRVFERHTIRAARAAAREPAWALAGDTAPGADGNLVTVDLDATIVIAHSEKEEATPTWKKTVGFHPMTAFAIMAPAGTGSRWPSCPGRRAPGPTRPRPYRGGGAGAGAAASPAAPQGPGPRRLRRRHARVPDLIHASWSDEDRSGNRLRLRRVLLVYGPYGPYTSRTGTRIVLGLVSTAGESPATCGCRARRPLSAVYGRHLYVELLTG
jgi:hypothetical protein